MGRNKSSKSLIHQVKECLDAKLAIGESKYLAKLNGTYTNYIFFTGDVQKLSEALLLFCEMV